MNRSLAVWLLVLGSVAPMSVSAMAEPPKGRPPAKAAATGTAGNAALMYYAIWTTRNEEDMKTVSELYGDVKLGNALPLELHKALERNQGDINRLMKAAAVKNCDFGLDRSEGFMLLLPHLSKMRASARLLAADAKRCMAEGKPDDAADRYVAILGLARHASMDKILISSLVSVAVASLPVSDLVEQKGAAMLTSAGRTKILAALERFGGAEGFGLKGALEGEREMAIDANIALYDGPDAGRRMVDELLKPIMHDNNGDKPDPEGDARVQKLRAMDGNALHAELRKMGRFYEHAQQVWDGPDPQKQIAKLSKAADDGEYGELGRFFLPALGKCRSSQDKGAKALADLESALRQAEEAAKAGK